MKFFRTKKQSHKIHVGCGPHSIMEGWTNVDINPFSGVDEVLDVTKEWPFKNVSYIYAEHFLEHLELRGALEFLVQAGNSLKKNGTIRLTTPNLTWVMKSHYFTDPESIRDPFAQTLAINRAFHGWGHKFLYDKTFLETVLKTLGYHQIKFCNWGESPHSELCNIEQHGEPSVGAGEAHVLIVEASKVTPLNVPSDFLHELESKFILHVEAGH